jgi:hypothetical protein
MAQEDTFVQTQSIHLWTPEERNDWIDSALSSEEEHGVKKGFHYSLMMKQLDNVLHIDDEKRQFATSSLASALYAKHPLFKRISLCLYKFIMQKIYANSFISLMHKRRNFVMMIKGSNAYKMLLRQKAQDIAYSDLDIIIFINPNLSDDMFEQIKSSLSVLITQSLSRFKKDLDATFFALEDKLEEGILRKELVDEFTHEYMNLLKNIDFESEMNGVILSPFENNSVRNLCSKRSFVILESNIKENHVVRVEIPHFNKCEYIPLKKTPFVVSHNKTIKFNRDIEGTLYGDFELFRIRLNNIFVPNCVESDNGSETSNITDNSSEVNIKKYKIVPSDFIDISIPSKNDAELIDFWNTGGLKRCYEIYDKCSGTNIMIPNVNECIRDLDNMLNKYTNSNLKIEKRKKRLELFKFLHEERRKQKEENTI